MNFIKKSYSSSKIVYSLKFCAGKHQFVPLSICDCSDICKMLPPNYNKINQKISNTKKFNEKYINKDPINNFNCLFTNKPPLKKDCNCSSKCSAGQSELELYFNIFAF